MKKDRIRDYAEDSFRLYAKYGYPTREQFEDSIRRSVQRDMRNKNPEEVLLVAEDLVIKKKSLADDIEAVEKTFDILKKQNKDYIIKAVKAVYCVSPNAKTRRNEISMRARAFSIHISADISTVFRWLEHARRLYAKVRGLADDSVVNE